MSLWVYFCCFAIHAGFLPYAFIVYLLKHPLWNFDNAWDQSVFVWNGLPLTSARHPVEIWTQIDFIFQGKTLNVHKEAELYNRFPCSYYPSFTNDQLMDNIVSIIPPSTHLHLYYCEANSRHYNILPTKISVALKGVLSNL